MEWFQIGHSILFGAYECLRVKEKKDCSYINIRAFVTPLK